MDYKIEHSFDYETSRNLTPLIEDMLRNEKIKQSQWTKWLVTRGENCLIISEVHAEDLK